MAECCILPVTELLFILLLSASRQSVDLVRYMTVVDFRSLISSCIPVASDPCRPSTSVGAAGMSSHSFHDASAGRVIAAANLRISPDAANVSGEELLASSSHQASTRVADLSSSRVLNESGMMATSSPVADLTSQRRDRSGE